MSLPASTAGAKRAKHAIFACTDCVSYRFGEIFAQLLGCHERAPYRAASSRPQGRNHRVRRRRHRLHCPQPLRERRRSRRRQSSRDTGQLRSRDCRRAPPQALSGRVAQGKADWRDVRVRTRDRSTFATDGRDDGTPSALAIWNPALHRAVHAGIQIHDVGLAAERAQRRAD